MILIYTQNRKTMELDLPRLFEDFSTNPSALMERMMTEYRPMMRSALSRFNTTPRVDMYPVEGGLELKADLPGMSKEDINLSVNGDQIILSGERKSQVERDSENWHFKERYFGKFTRNFKLPFEVEKQNVSAKFDNGVLTVNIPEPNPEKSQEGKIQIQ